METATVFKEVNELNRVCFFTEGEEIEVRIKLATGFGHWMSVVVKKGEFDKFISALMVLSPNIKLEIN